MVIYVPEHLTKDVGKFFPKLGSVKKEAKKIDTSFRPKQIYQILEMLAITERLNRKNMFGDVVCLDVGGNAPEAAVFVALKAKSIKVAEGRQYLDVSQFPGVEAIRKTPTETLRKLPSNSADLITMFNTWVADLRDPKSRKKIIQQAARVLHPGGQVVITGESAMMNHITALEKEVDVGILKEFNLRTSLPRNQMKPMGNKGWVLGSILAENALGLDYDKLGIKVEDRTLDGSIIVIEK